MILVHLSSLEGAWVEGPRDLFSRHVGCVQHVLYVMFPPGPTARLEFSSAWEPFLALLLSDCHEEVLARVLHYLKQLGFGTVPVLLGHITSDLL